MANGKSRTSDFQAAGALRQHPKPAWDIALKLSGALASSGHRQAARLDLELRLPDRVRRIARQP